MWLRGCFYFFYLLPVILIYRHIHQGILCVISRQPPFSSLSTLFAGGKTKKKKTLHRHKTMYFIIIFSIRNVSDLLPNTLTAVLLILCIFTWFAFENQTMRHCNVLSFISERNMFYFYWWSMFFCVTSSLVFPHFLSTLQFSKFSLAQYCSCSLSSL